MAPPSCVAHPLVTAFIPTLQCPPTQLLLPLLTLTRSRVHFLREKTRERMTIPKLKESQRLHSASGVGGRAGDGLQCRGP
mmetsp:Transcript_150704/g.263399  ORF Transcript_150704/g.263399 Transcript_150704/m.263399 type:complete len:80 (+) Transcript_150704:1198-1437(+)